jgi:glycosyltransferase involved in cell wall biosynthesis
LGLRKKLTESILPIGSRRRAYVKRLVKRPTTPDISPATFSYAEWLKRCEPLVFRDTAAKLAESKNRPLISVVVPCYNTPDKYLIPLVESVTAQLYENWQLVLVDGSNVAARNEAIELCAKTDERITYKKVGENLGIVGNTNVGLGAVAGEFVAFMDHDDTLSPYALAEMVIAINANPDVELLYSDEDKLSDDGKKRLIPFFKPDWSPELLLGVNYITHFVVVKKALVEKIGGLRPGFDGAQDYDFLLRLTEQTSNIQHIPKMLYHWRLAEGSTAKAVGEKNYADTAGQRALADAVRRRGIKAEVVEIPDRPTNYRLRYKLPAKKPLVSIVIPFKDKVELLEVCVPSILKSSYENYEIILVSNNSVEEKTHTYLAKLRKQKKCKVHTWDHPFNYSAVNNFGRKKAKGEYLVFLNNDTEILESNWLEELVSVATQQDVGAVGPMLLYPDKTIQHAGVVLGMNTMAGHVFRFRQPHEWTDFGLALWPRNYLAVTGACLTVKASKFDEVGGFDELLTIGGNDVALGLRLYESGYRNVYWPFTRLIHYENVSVGSYDSNVPIGDYNRSLVYYDKYLKEGDPYFNPNLDLMNEQVGLRSKYE